MENWSAHNPGPCLGKGSKIAVSKHFHVSKWINYFTKTFWFKKLFAQIYFIHFAMYTLIIYWPNFSEY